MMPASRRGIAVNEHMSAIISSDCLLKRSLEELYERVNRREYVHPDPLEYLYMYKRPEDLEVVGLIASSLAYGRVGCILDSVGNVLGRIGSPREFVVSTSRRKMRELFSGFRHRFTTGDDLAAVLFGAGEAINKHGSLRACFVSGLRIAHETVIPALSSFVREVSDGSPSDLGHLLPSPERGSACKRLNLFLRWMVRRDAVDPGGWDEVPPSKLVIPLDTHMHRIALGLGLTERKSADRKAALEITEGFGMLAPSDPVRYDFALTRFGIRGEKIPEFISRHTAEEVTWN
jgi:uncharacterized protein (TIGR02757 family)